ncbi:DMT family transporter [Pelagicoccus sp. SDUM812003]|uniref:DMT family transporter n=1 Tax=Pelagicoccus sp. SDUM812003 TaxID=3041267 RepID=UPI00280F18A5|nr:DMT family transporter [Pelagicoccus sp. SDUM812003]MDQ8201835.1 DMT family transporter [Pelagicoccus sp. SDUM812003]
MNTVFVALAALCWGLSGGIAAMLMSRGWDAFVVALLRASIGLLFFVVWLTLRPSENGMKDLRLWGWSAMAGVGVAGNFAFYFLSISEGSVAVASTLMYCAPVFVFLVSFALKLERPTPIKWASIGIVIFGIVLLTRVYSISPEELSLLGAGAGLLSGLSYAVFILSFKFASSHGSAQAILTIAFSVVVVTLFGPAEGNRLLVAFSSANWILFVALGTLGAGVSFILYVVGLKRTAPSVASIVATIEPISASVFGVLILNENLTRPQIVGMILILAAVTSLSGRSGSRSN